MNKLEKQIKDIKQFKLTKEQLERSLEHNIDKIESINFLLKSNYHFSKEFKEMAQDEIKRIELILSGLRVVIREME